MEFAFVIYLISMLSSLNIMLVIAFCISCAVVLVYTIYWTSEGIAGVYSKGFKYNFLAVYITIAVAIANTIVPSERTMYMMLGAYASQTVVQSKIGQDVIKIIEVKLEQELKELTKPKDEKR